MATPLMPLTHIPLTTTLKHTQAALDIPLTVYGTGGQTRGFIHISDTARCIEIAINNPPKAGEKVEVFNQIAETLRVRDLAQTISDKTGVQIRHLENPRKEDAENELDVANAKFKAAGLNPITVEMGLMEEVVDITKKYSKRCDRSATASSAPLLRSASMSQHPLLNKRHSRSATSSMAAPVSARCTRARSSKSSSSTAAPTSGKPRCVRA